MSFNENNSCGVVYMSAPGIKQKHGFVTRYGGVSRGIYESLNLSLTVGDNDADVLENYRRLRRAFALPSDGSGIVFSHQVHSKTVRVCTGADTHTLMSDIPYDADGLVTNEKGLCLIIFTADCTPILLADENTHAVGAVHAGWRGTVLDIAGEAVRKMISEYGSDPRDIRAAIGPCISACCFETDADVPTAVKTILGGSADTFIRPSVNDNKYFVDLKGVNRELLINAGLSSDNIFVSDECTVCRSDKYWSHRATKGHRGSQASLIICD